MQGELYAGWPEGMLCFNVNVMQGELYAGWPEGMLC